MILAIGGSWCPNCHDEAPFLSELYKDYRARGLEIVGLMFENDPDPKVSGARVQSFVKRYGVQYQMVFAGTMQASPTTKTIAEALPQLVNFGAYPTTIMLGRDGRVRNVRQHSAATGGAHPAQAGVRGSSNGCWPSPQLVGPCSLKYRPDGTQAREARKPDSYVA
jgi:thiol-disulfide isomerase/thioredoxin